MMMRRRRRRKTSRFHGASAVETAAVASWELTVLQERHGEEVPRVGAGGRSVATRVVGCLSI
eukprot:6854747-Pyramimonas_sp.AAC.1